MQQAMAQYLADASTYLDLPAFYQAKRDRFVNGLSGSRFRLRTCSGTFFILADYSRISDEPEESFARRLTTEPGVAAIPVSALYDQPIERKLVRFCFAKKDATLDRALERLRRT